MERTPPTPGQMQIANVVSIWLIVAGLWKTVEVAMVCSHWLLH